MSKQTTALDKTISIVVPHGHFDALAKACDRRGENVSVFGRRAIYAEMTKSGLLSPDGKLVSEA